MKSIHPYQVYLSTRFVESLLFTSIITVNLVYQVTVVGLNPLQLVLVGTLLEAVAFLSEIPTGLLADVYSRKLSTVIGVILIGLGFVIEGSFPTFLFVMLSQKEEHYHPTPMSERPSWHHLMQTFLESVRLVRDHHILLTIIAISCVFGMFSEGFDRLWTPYIMQFTFPAIGNLKPIVWLNQNITPNIRATVFSMSSQSNALGQIMLGPVMGLIATVFSLRVAMIGSGMILIPIIFLYLFTIRRHKLLA